MSRRHTINHKSPASDYPEHLNPFRDEEENKEEDNNFNVNNKFSTVGRRNSRLSASFRMRSWSMFSSKNAKSTEKHSVEPEEPLSPKSSKTKFATLTPKLSHRILEALSPKKSKNKVILTPIPQYIRADPSITDFKITPKTDRVSSTAITVAETVESTGGQDREKHNQDSEENRFTTIKKTAVYEDDSSNKIDEPLEMTSELFIEERDSTLPRLMIEENAHPHEKCETQPKAKLRFNQPPVPLPRTIVPVVAPRVGTSDDDCQPSTSEASRRLLLNNPKEVNYIQQGAKPKKKRQAPLPPSPAVSTSVKQSDPIESDTSASPSASVASSTPEPALHLETTLPETQPQDEVA